MQGFTLGCLLATWVWLPVFKVDAQVYSTVIGQLPEPITNTAAVGADKDGASQIYCFGGLDSSKSYAGIHRRCYRYDIALDQVFALPDLPDTLGKIAAAATVIGDVIYIMGGYHVFQDHSEISSDRVHRFSVSGDSFLSDGAKLPIPTDDHVQLAWRDSLIYVITGWSQSGNIPDVQVYNPTLDTWTSATPVPNNNAYKSFGASGAIIGDTIFYFGGASSGFGFNIQAQLRKGVIDATNPLQITWTVATPDPSVVAYRSAALAYLGRLFWIGGSEVTYNYDGVAYNGSGGVPPSGRLLELDPTMPIWESHGAQTLPMDLRGCAHFGEALAYVVGGMVDNQEVTANIYEVDFGGLFSSIDERATARVVYPNPCRDQIEVGADIDWVMVISASGRSRMLRPQNGMLEMAGFPAGAYVLRLQTANGFHASIRVVKI